MLYTTLAIAVFAFASSAVASQKQKPECVDKCWTNSQYVSQCMGDHQCLCEDQEFQNALYQCLYSQCSTSKFGTALHFALQSCHDEEEVVEHAEMLSGTSAASIPALFHMDQGLKAKRTASVSNSVSVTRSVTRSVTQSASASNTRTRTRTRTTTRSITRTVQTNITRSVTRTPRTRARVATHNDDLPPAPTVYLQAREI